MLINNEFNKIQINETVDKDANGNIVRRSLMVNIRCNDVEEADKLYCQLKTKLNSRAVIRNDGRNRTTGNSGNGNAPICHCGRPMVLRQGRKGMFYGCTGYPRCQLTRDSNRATEVDADELRVEEIQV